MPGCSDPLFTDSYCPKGLWLLQGAHVMPRQPACALAASWRSEQPQEMGKSHPSVAVSMSWSLVSLGRVFLTLNGAITTEYTINVHVAPGKKYMLRESLLCEECFICRRSVLVFFLQRSNELQNICNMAASKAVTAIKARWRVKEGTTKGWQGSSKGGYREHSASGKVPMKDLVWKLVTKVTMKRGIPSWYPRRKESLSGGGEQ